MTDSTRMEWKVGKHSEGTKPLFTREGRLWLVIAIVPLLVQISLLQDWIVSSETRFESPMSLFLVVLIAASLCIVTSAMVLWRAVSTSTPELITLGLFFMAVSALPLAHGITTPGVFYGENTATVGAAFWAVPVGVWAASPALLPRARYKNFLLRHAYTWMAFWVLTISTIAIVSVVWPTLSPAFIPGRAFEKVVSALAIGGTLSLSYRQIRLAQIAHSAGPLVFAAGYGFVAATGAIWFGVELWSLGFWAAHAFDIGGVFLATIGALVAYRKVGNVQHAVAPILVSDPVSALELGLEPIIHTYVADLEAKDPITRDHVVRTSELALLVGEELGYSGERVRRISLVGLLHDVGKLDVPDELLMKPDKLTDKEFEVVQQHPVNGANRVLDSSLLAPLAPGIRSHHERIDGRGYPDQLKGDEIPIEARIVSACDAYDAMANTRNYRRGMGHTKAVAILREHQGAQWDVDVVDALVCVVERRPLRRASRALDNVGRVGGPAQVGCDCLPEAHADHEEVADSSVETNTAILSLSEFFDRRAATSGLEMAAESVDSAEAIR